MKKFKKYIKPLVFTFIFISLFFFLYSCSTNVNYNNKKNLKDLSNRDILLNGVANKIAALAPSDCEILSEIGAQDKIIARGTYCDYPKEITNIEDVGSGDYINLEKLVSLKPDIILISKMGYSIDKVKSIENLGLTVAVNEADNFDDTFKYIEFLSKISGCEQQGQQLITNMKDKINMYSNKSKKLPKKTVYFQISNPQQANWTAGKNTFLNEMSNILNCKNIFDDIDGWCEVSQEQILDRNPDITITIDNNKSFTRPGPRLMEALEKMYKIVYE